MTLSEILGDSNLDYLLSPRPFQNIKPYRADLFAQELEYIKKHKPKIYMIPDTDVDGVLTAKIMYDTISTVTDIGITVHIFEERSHGITDAIAYDIIKNNYNYVVILDSSTNNMEQIKMMTGRGLRVLILDHHLSKNRIEDYPEGSIVFNNRIDVASGVKIPYCEASCGLLVALYCNYGLSILGYRMPDINWLYAMITLYSDAMDTMDPFNVMIINYARNCVRLNRVLSRLSGKRDNNPTRNIITYSINPKINACIRCGRMDLIYKLLFTDISSAEEEALCDEINDINSSIKETLSEIEGTLLFTEVLSVLLIDLTEYLDTPIISFKGYLANKFSTNSGKVCIAYYRVGNMIYGSVRDSLGRNVHSVFKEYCFAEGHPSALGIEVGSEYLGELARYVSYCLQDVEAVHRAPIILEDVNSLLSLENIKEFSICNEYATTNSIGIRLKLDPYSFKITSYNGLYIIKSNKFTVKSSIPVNYGDTIIAVPTFGSQIELRLKTRCS